MICVARGLRPSMRGRSTSGTAALLDDLQGRHSFESPSSHQGPPSSLTQSRWRFEPPVSARDPTRRVSARAVDAEDLKISLGCSRSVSCTKGRVGRAVAILAQGLRVADASLHLLLPSDGVDVVACGRRRCQTVPCTARPRPLDPATRSGSSRRRAARDVVQEGHVPALRPGHGAAALLWRTLRAPRRGH